VWSVVHRLDEVLSQTPPVAREFRPSAASPLGPVSMPGPLSAARDERAGPEPLAAPQARELAEPRSSPADEGST
jgi:hypothetical protein